MALYTQYGALDASGAAQLASYAIEQSVGSTWVNTLGRTTPVLAALMNKGRLNKGFKVKGRMLITPVIAAETDVQFAGVTDANQFTAMTNTITTGDTQAEYNFAHYRGMFNLTDAEMQLLTAPEGTARGSILSSKKAKLESIVTKLIATNTSGAGVGSRTAHMGILNPVNAANATVGGIAQADLTGWQNVRDITGGVFSLQRVDDLLDQVERGNAVDPVDLLLCTNGSGGPNILNSFRQLISANNENVIVSANGAMAKYGFRSFEYAGISVVGDSFMSTGAASGKVLGIASGSFFVASSSSGAKPTPKMHTMTRIQGTDAYEQVFTFWYGMGCSNPANNFYMGSLLS